jgi:hypothetical protein
VNSLRWTKTTVDWAEQTVIGRKAGFTAGINTVLTSVYDNKGRLKSVSAFAGANRIAADMLYEYDELGQHIRQGLDLNATAF